MNERLFRRFIKCVIRESSHGDSKLGVKNKIINITSNDEIATELEPDMIDLIQKSYANIGGHHKITGPGSLVRSYDTWAVADVDSDPEPDVGAFGSKQNNKVKLGAVATDGGQEGKNFLLKLKKEILQNGWWGEVSGAVAHIAINKLGLSTIDDEKTVNQLLGNKNIEWLGSHPDGKYPSVYGWYKRSIGDNQHVKIIVGDI